MSFRTLLRLRSAAGRALKPLKPIAANATVPSSTSASYKLLLPRIGYSSAYTSPALKTMELAKKREDGDVVIVAGGGIRGRRCPPGSRCEVQCSKAYRIYGEMYAFVYVLSWMIGRVGMVETGFADMSARNSAKSAENM